MSQNKQILLLSSTVLLGLILSLSLLAKHKDNLVQFYNASNLMIIPKDLQYYDEVLTMSANMASFTHKPEWEARFNKAIIDIKNTMLKAKELFPKMIEKLDLLEKLGAKLISFERASFELIRQNKFQEAQYILMNEEYNEAKTSYVKVLDNIIDATKESAHSFEINVEEKFKFFISIISLIVILTIILSAWLFIVFRKQANDLKGSEESLSNQHELLEKIVDTVPVRMFWKDKNGIYLGVNKLFLNDARLNKKSDIIGKTDFEMIWKSEAQKYREDDASVIKTGIARLNYEEYQSKKDGTFIDVLTSKVPLIDTKNNIIGILGIYDDITEQKNLKKIAETKEKYIFEQSRFAQMGEMISMIAHQWRQPLASISAISATLNLDVMMNNYKKEFFEERLSIVGELAQHLSTTIDDFRGFFKEDKEMTKITMPELIRSCLHIIEPSLKAKGIIIEEEIEKDIILNTYSNELKQVVLNLLKNSEEAMEEKMIKNPKILCKGYTKDDKAYIIIEDNAGGIPDEIIEKIFDPYFSTKIKKDGTGLGLYMSRIIIEDHCHGRLTVANTDNGASFVIELNNVS